MKFEVTVLGSSSATPVYNRNPSAQILNCNDSLYLIDCGEGTQLQLLKYGIKASKIDHIFITHLHGDHYFGLVGLLSTLHLNGRTKALQLFGPAALLNILELQFKHSDTVLKYPLEFFPVDPNSSSVIMNTKDIKVEAFPLNHRIPCTGYKFTKPQPALKLNMDSLEQDQVPLEYYALLKRGVDVETLDGKKLPFLKYTLPPVPPRTYAYCSDTLFEDSYFPYIQNCDLLYHEATFLQDLIERAILTHHSTALNAAMVAKETNAKKLIIGHFSSRYKTLAPLLEEARSVFRETELAVEGRTFLI